MCWYGCQAASEGDFSAGATQERGLWDKIILPEDDEIKTAESHKMNSGGFRSVQRRGTLLVKTGAHSI